MSNILQQHQKQRNATEAEKKGTKMMFGKRYNNCVKKEGFSNRGRTRFWGKDSSKKIDEDWQLVNRKDKTDGLSQKQLTHIVGESGLKVKNSSYKRS